MTIGALKNIPKEEKREKSQRTLHLYDDLGDRAEMYILLNKKKTKKHKDLSALVNDLLGKFLDQQDKKKV